MTTEERWDIDGLPDVKPPKKAGIMTSGRSRD